jgi:Tetratricopeptide repeat
MRQLLVKLVLIGALGAALGESPLITELDPRFTAVYALAGTGNVYYEVPGVLGDDLELERIFKRCLEPYPKFAGTPVGLAKTLIKKGRIADARRELQAVLEEKASTNRADWARKNAQKAWALLESITSKSS